MRCDECEARLYEAGEVVPAGNYVRVDDSSSRVFVLDRDGPLPPAWDGHVALYRLAASTCACARRAARTDDSPAR